MLAFPAVGDVFVTKIKPFLRRATPCHRCRSVTPVYRLEDLSRQETNFNAQGSSAWKISMGTASIRRLLAQRCADRRPRGVNHRRHVRVEAGALCEIRFAPTAPAERRHQRSQDSVRVEGNV